METKFLLTHGRTHILNGDVMPAFSTVPNALSALTRYFNLIGRAGEWVPPSTGNPMPVCLCARLEDLLRALSLGTGGTSAPEPIQTTYGMNWTRIGGGGSGTKEKPSGKRTTKSRFSQEQGSRFTPHENQYDALRTEV